MRFGIEDAVQNARDFFQAAHVKFTERYVAEGEEPRHLAAPQLIRLP